MTDDREWLETDGLGGFASGTVSGDRTRRYHALLLTATEPPAGRFVLVNGIEVFLTTAVDRYALSRQHYRPNVFYPDGHRNIESFESHPWPKWVYRFNDGTRLSFEVFVPHGTSAVVLLWTRLTGPSGACTLMMRPLMSGRDYHSLHHENPDFRFEAQRHRLDGIGQHCLTWRPYDGVPGTTAFTNAAYTSEPLWYRNFLYSHETERGLDDTEDLASPGIFHFDLSREAAVCIFTADGANAFQPRAGESPAIAANRLAAAERDRRSRFATPLHKAADAYIVRRGGGKTIIAGYPWFTDWGRDTFIALRGLCLATGRLDEAGRILFDWAGAVSEGMLPNRFPDQGGRPEFNSVDASLWCVIAVYDYLRVSEASGREVNGTERNALTSLVAAILDGYETGTRYGIRADHDGLLASGEAGVQLTWMDAKVGDWVVTPRIGKPVEVQALWINALWIGSQLDTAWRPRFEQAREAFRSRFWNANQQCLYDVVDVNHQPGSVEAAIRPNQIFAVGGLPLQLLDDEHARKVVDVVEAKLLTPLGLRTLEPSHADYHPRYQGSIWERDGAYHQGTVWPWLLGPFVEAWIRVRGSTNAVRLQAREKFLPSIDAHLDQAGLGHVSEITDAEPPYTPRGCPFQAWSVGELLRLRHDILEDESAETIDFDLDARHG